MALETLDIINGVFSLIFVVLSLFVGLRIVSKYPKAKQKILLFVGFTWTGMCTPWLPSTVSFLTILISGESLPAPVLFTLGCVFLPIVLILWMIAFTELLYKKKQKFIVLLFVILAIVFYTVFFTQLAIDPDLIGTVSGPTDINYRLFVTVFQLGLLVIILITGTMFARKSITATDPEIKLKGKFLLLAFLFFVIGAICDVISGMSIVILIFGRIILILAAIHFYYGFFLPNWMSSLFIRSE